MQPYIQALWIVIAISIREEKNKKIYLLHLLKTVSWLVKNTKYVMLIV